MMHIQSHQRGKRASTMIYLNGAKVATAHAHSNQCADPEKLATLISLKRALHFASKYAVMLPPSVRGLLAIAASIAELRYEAAKTGDKTKLAKAQVVLEKAKQNPSRIIRAGAAALAELLKK